MKLNENILRSRDLLLKGLDIAFKNVGLDEPDALRTFAGLVMIEKAVNVLKNEYMDEAVALAKKDLELCERESGSFRHNGFVYSLSSTTVYDFVGKPQKYYDEIGTEYRVHYKSQQEYKKASAACTKMLSALKAKYAIEHPKVEPEEVQKKLSLQFVQTMKVLNIDLPEVLQE